MSVYVTFQRILVILASSRRFSFFHYYYYRLRNLLTALFTVLAISRLFSSRIFNAARFFSFIQRFRARVVDQSRVGIIVENGIVLW